MPKYFVKLKQERLIEKLSLPTTVNGDTTYYAEIIKQYNVEHDTDLNQDVETLISTNKDLVRWDGMTKEEVLTALNDEKTALISKHTEDLSYLNDMIDQLEAE